MKPNIILLLIITGIFSCSHKPEITKTEAVIPEKLDTIEYAYRGYGHSEKLRLFSNGLFKYYKSCMVGTNGYSHFYTYYGSYIKNKNHIKLYPDSLIFARHFDEIRLDTLVKKHLLYQPVKLFGKREYMPIKTDYDIIRCGNLELILSENTVITFNNPIYFFFYHQSFAVNDNDFTNLAEYITKKPTFRNITRQYLHRKSGNINENDTISSSTIQNIPKQWQYLFQSNKIEASIKESIYDNRGEYILSDFFEINKTYFYDIDKGADDGIRFGMIFFDKKSHPYKVMWLDKHKSIVVTIERNYKNRHFRLHKGEILFN